MTTYEKLIKCFEGIDYEMNKKQFFLLGFYTCAKFIKDSKCIEKSNFEDTFNEFLCDYVIESKESLFEIDDLKMNNDRLATETKIKERESFNKQKEKNEKIEPFDNDEIKIANNLIDFNFSIFDPIQIPLIQNDSGMSQPKKQVVLTCNICQNDFSTEDLENYKLDCGHFMHFECFKTYIHNQLNEGNLNIVCFECSNEVSTANIQFFLYQVGEGLFEKHEKLLLNKFISSRVTEVMWCPTPGCEFVFEMAEKFQKFSCRICKKSWCLGCRVEYHENKSCDQYKEERRKATDQDYLDNEFDRAAQSLKYKPCPRCKFWIEKSSGCNHMTCRCGNEFCYVCGAGYVNRAKSCRC